MQVRVAEASEIKPILSPLERFHEMCEHNPALKMLQQDLHLRLH